MDNGCPTPARKVRPNMKEQLEISFARSTQCRRPLRSERRRDKAQWWFNKMRYVVDCAFDWKSAPPAPAIQTYFCLDKRR